MRFAGFLLGFCFGIYGIFWDFFFWDFFGIFFRKLYEIYLSDLPLANFFPVGKIAEKKV